MKKRTWCYAMKPTAYEISCDICGGHNITWSEYEKRIWCYDCQKDTLGNEGIFDGPIPINVCQILGFSLDRVDIKTGKRLVMQEINGKLEWMPEVS